MPSVENKITLGNLVSWALVIIGVVVSYTHLQDAQAHTATEVQDIKAKYAISASEQNSLKVDIEVIKTKVGNINDKIDSLIEGQKTKKDEN